MNTTHQLEPISKATLPRCLPTKFKSIGRRVFKLESGNQNVNVQTDTPTGTSYNSNLTQVVSYHPVKFQIDPWKHLQIRTKMLMNGCLTHQSNGPVGPPKNIYSQNMKTSTFLHISVGVSDIPVHTNSGCLYKTNKWNIGIPLTTIIIIMPLLNRLSVLNIPILLRLGG